MGHVESSSIANAPADFAFGYTSDYRNLPKWMLGISHAELVSAQATGVGTQIDTTIDIGPKKLAIRLESVEWVEGRLLGFKTIKGLAAVTQWGFEALDDGRTRITAVADYEVGGLAGKVLDKLLQAFAAVAVGHVEKHLGQQIEASFAEFTGTASH